MSDLFGIRYALREASDHILVAMTHDGLISDFRLDQARDAIARGFAPGAPVGDGEEWLVDLIATAIAAGDRASDFDVTYEDQARFVVDALFKHLKPEGE